MATVQKNSSTGCASANSATGCIITCPVPSCDTCFPAIKGFNITTTGVTACPDLILAGVSSAQLNVSIFVPYVQTIIITNTSPPPPFIHICQGYIQIATVTTGGNSYPVFLVWAFYVELAQLTISIQFTTFSGQTTDQFSLECTGTACGNSCSGPNNFTITECAGFNLAGYDGSATATPVT